MVGETGDSILIKECKVENSFYLYNIAMMFLSKHHGSIHIKII